MQSLGAEAAEDEDTGGRADDERAARWMAAWDAVCDGLVAPEAFAAALLARLPYAQEPLFCDWLTGLDADAAWDVVVESIAHFSR